MRAIDADRLLQVLEINFGHTGGADVMRQLIEAQPTLTPPNEPLTLDELREMDGEPVWIVDIGGRNWYGPGWAIVDRENNLVRTAKNWNAVFFEKYGERWLAYCPRRRDRRKNMKKIPTLFERIYENHRVVGITPNVTPGMEWVLEGKGTATVKIDGSCCAVIGGKLYRRYDAKKGKKPPEGAIPCCDPDPMTGHWPHWVECRSDNPADKWYLEAFFDSIPLEDATYEAIGPHFQGNPYRLDMDVLDRHGRWIIQVERSFKGIRDFLRENHMEGIVFWRDGEPQCKIKRSDFGFPWPGEDT